jgi:hypothetical protein
LSHLNHADRIDVPAFAARPGDPSDANIYVNEASAVYASAVRKPSALALLKLAATLVHEQVHNTDGEFAAYRLQSDFVRSRLTSIPGQQRDEAHAYVQGLDARAFARQFGIHRPACGLRAVSSVSQ